MLKTYSELKIEYSNYANPKTKIARLVRDGFLMQVARGLYETDSKVNPLLLANAIYGPSYISFQTALSYYGLVPDVTQSFTSATTLKRHSREYENTFGRFIYRDVPNEVFSLSLADKSIDDYCCLLASPEKAICDMLYIVAPVQNMQDFKSLLFENLRINEDDFYSLDLDTMMQLAQMYHSTNLKFLGKMVKEIR